jgi:hypothetical protein
VTAKKREEIKNLVESIRARLLNVAKAQEADFSFILKLFFLERFLYRLGSSPWRDKFALKGALVFFARADDAARPYARPTKDIDLEAMAMKNDPAEIIEVFKIIAAIHADDAVRFDPDSIEVEQIHEDARYAGIRVHIDAYLGKATDRIQVDIGFGDAVTPGPVIIEYPTLLPTVPKPDLQAYPFETVIAEKWEATVSLGEANSRFKDHIDLEELARTQSFDGALLQKAIRNTFASRGTAIDLSAAALTVAYRDDRQRQIDYAAARKRLKRTEGLERFADAMTLILAFLEPIHRASAEKADFTGRWDPDARRWR